MKKYIILLFVVLLSISLVLIGCGKHECESKCPVCQKCTDSSCTEKACQDKCQGHTPAHTCESVCPTCGKCTDATCTDAACANKCQGHTSVHVCESVCPTCGKCTDIACSETACSNKCTGHNDAHTCQNVCPECGKCTNIVCGEEVCADKCAGHYPDDPDPAQPPKGTVIGYITHEGKPLAGVDVTMGQKHVQSMRSGKVAMHSIDLNGGTIVFSMDGFFEETIVIDADDFVDGVATFNLVMNRKATLKGYVYELNGPIYDASHKVPLAGATVTLDGVSVVTGSDGAFVFDEIIARDGVAVITKDGYGTVTRLILSDRYVDGVLEGVEVFIHRMATVTGRVIDNMGRGLSGVTVYCRSAKAITDDDGYYQLSVFPESEGMIVDYELYFEKDGYVAVQKFFDFGWDKNNIDYSKEIEDTVLLQEALPAENLIANSTDERLNVYGRTLFHYGQNADLYSNVMSGFEVKFFGTKLTADFHVEEGARLGSKEYPQFTTWSIFIDGQLTNMMDPINNMLFCDDKDPSNDSEFIKVAQGQGFWEVRDFNSADAWVTYTIVDGLPEGEHTVRILKTDDPLISKCFVRNLRTDGRFLAAPEKPTLKIDVYGDSITSGGDNMLDFYGHGSWDVIPRHTNGAATYASYAGFKLNADVNVFARCGMALSSAFGGDDTYVAMTYKQVSPTIRQTWNLNNFKADIVVIGLGTNDQLGDMSKFVSSYKQFIKELAGYYGSDTTFILVHGFADYEKYPGGHANQGQDIPVKMKPSILQVASEMKSAGYNVHTLEFAPEPRLHPMYQEHYTAGMQLADLLISLGFGNK